MTRRSDRDFLAADLVAVDNLLSQLGDDDVVARFGLKSRREEITFEISTLDELPTITQAEVSLFFSGKPVNANKGISAEFSSRALASYQDSINKISAFQRFGSLGDRGAVAGKDKSALYLTNVVRGSFGFQLEEIEPQLSMQRSELKEAVDDSTKLILAFSSPDEEEYTVGIQQVEQRIVDSIFAFFSLLKDEEATVRLVTDGTDKWIDKTSIERAIDRIKSIKIDINNDMPIKGSLTGVLPTTRRFDFSPAGGDVISGIISSGLVDSGLEHLQTEWLFKVSIGYFQIRTVSRPGRDPKNYYTLLRIGPTDETSLA